MSEVKIACPHCGGTNFWVHEGSTAKAYVNDEKPNVLHVRTEGGEIERVECMSAGCPESKDGLPVDITDWFWKQDVEVEYD